jgi:hypothetical protein
MSKGNIYDKLLSRASGSGQQKPQSSSGGSRFGVRTTATQPGRFSGGGDSSSSNSTTRSKASDRPIATPVKKDGRIIAADRGDRDLAYSPPVAQQNQATVWSPPTVGEIFADLGLRLIEVGIASMAQEVAYFFADRRFLPRFLRRG